MTPKSVLNLTIPEFRNKDRLLVRVRALRWQYNFWKSYAKKSDYQKFRACTPKSYKLKLFEKHIEYLDNIIRLDQYSVICNTLSELPKSTKQHVILFIGIYIPRKADWDRREQQRRNELDSLRNRQAHPAEIKYAELMLTNCLIAKNVRKEIREKTIEARVAETRTRWIFETTQRVNEGWFIIYNTLTADDYHYKQVFKKGSSAWTDYIRLVDREIGIKKYGTWRKALEAKRNGEQWHTYYAVVEKGERTGRYHIHVVHHIAVLPEGSFDPNAGRTRPIYKELDSFRDFWQYGNSVPEMCRLSSDDAFAREGYQWPCDYIDTGKYKAADVQSAEGLARYLSKYLTKRSQHEVEDINKVNEGVLIWRSRQTQKIGMTIMTELMMISTKQELRMMSQDDKMPIIRIMGRMLPKMMMKNLALKQRIKLMFINKKIPLKLLNQILELERPEGLIRHLIKGDLDPILNRTMMKIGFSNVRTFSPEVVFSLRSKIINLSMKIFGQFNQIINIPVGAGIQIGENISC